MDALTLREVADRAGVSPSTLRRWIREGLIPEFSGEWTPAAAAHARMVARLRSRGHSLEDIGSAARSGRLAFGYLADLFPVSEQTRPLAEVAAETGLEPALIERIFTSLGYSAQQLDQISEQDAELLHDYAAVLAAGFPLVALLQLARVYGQSMAQVADAEIKLFHLYVHEPLIHEGVPGLEMAEEMNDLARELLPLARPIMERIHQRYLAHFVEQDIVGHMETDLDGEASLSLGRLRVAIAFADLAGYTRLTEEEGEESAVDAVERFIEAVEVTIPDDARVIKTIGDGVMIVGSDPAALAEWAVGFQSLMVERPRPRIGVHCGATLYRDGDYYGREVNIAARVVARAGGGEVLVTRPVVESADQAYLAFEPIGEVRLKGFRTGTELFLARQVEED